jgi:FtsH-binding integral membrane protein
MLRRVVLRSLCGLPQLPNSHLGTRSFLRPYSTTQTKLQLSSSITLHARVGGTGGSNSSRGGFGFGEVQPNYSPSTGTTGGSTADSLTPYVRQHLTRVYSLLGVGIAVAALGSASMFLTPLGKAIPYWLPAIGGFVPLLWLMWAPPANPQLKLGLFFAFTFLEGMAIAPIVYMSMAKGVLGTALVLTGAVFFGFSAAAYLSPRASLVAFQGPLYGMLLGLVAVSLLNMFYPTAFAHSLILYGGLALFSVFVAVDTQAMIERARCGAGDHVQDALQMFLNVINIFVRIAQMLRGE